MAITQVSTSVLKDGAVTSAKLDTNIAIDGNLTVDTDTLYVDSAANRVGIGTTNPSDELHITGTTASIRLQDSDGTNTFGRLRYTGSSVYFTSRNNTSNGNFIFIGSNGTSDTEYMRIHSGGDISFRDTSNNQAFYWDASTASLGIGTDSPNTILDVRDTDALIRVAVTNASGEATLELRGIGSSGTGNAISRLVSTPEGTDTASALRFETRNSSGTIAEKMRITSGGNVGIGVSPDEIFHIKATNAPTIRIESGDTSGASGEIIGEVDFWGNDFSGTGRDSRAFVRAEYEDAFARAALVFGSGAYNNTATEQMRITSGGNVGIGTDSPATKMHLQGFNTKLTITNTNATATGYHGIIFESLDGAGFTTQSLGQIDFISSAGATGLSARIEAEMANANGAGTIVFSAGAAGSASERMRITAGGDVSFRDTSNNQAFYWDASTARLGIGTGSSPDSNLHILSAASTPTVRIESTHPSGIPFLDLKGAASSQIRYIDETGTIQTRIDMSDNGGFSFVDVAGSSSPRMVISSSGNVGIGVSGPSSQLHVVGNIVGGDITTRFEPQSNNAKSTLYISSRGSGDGGYYYDSSNNTGGLFSYGDYTFNVGTSNISGTIGNPRMVIKQGGNVGIGTTNPSANLHVYQNGLSLLLGDNTYATKYLSIRGSSDGLDLGLQANTNLSTNGTIVYKGGNLKALAFKASTSTSLDTLTSADLFIDVNGNVGIGTTNPNYKLSVDDHSITSAPKTLLQFKSANIADGGGYDIDFRTSSNDLADRFVSRIRGVREGAGAKSQLSFWTDDGSSLGQRMTINSTGSVGIGTTSPSAKLEVSSTAPSGDRTLPHNVLTLTAESSGFPYNGFGGAINFKNTSYTYGILNSARIRSVIDSDSGSNRGAGLAFDVTNSSQVYNTSLFLKYDGNVGIGTTSPASILHLESASSPVLTIKDTTNDVKLLAYCQDSDSHIGTYSNHPLVFDTNSTERMRVASSGNVGIGTTNPLHALDLSNSAGSLAAGGIITATYFENDSGTGVANGFIASLNDEHGTTLNVNYHYEFQLTTTGTGTRSGANYVVYYESSTGTWNNRYVSISGGSSNHPLLTTSGTNVIIYDNHATGYNVRYNVKATYTSEDAASPHSLGAAYQWRRSVNDLFYDDGNVGIGTASPSEKLHVVGNIKATGDVVADCSSDERLKDNINIINNPIDKIKKIKGVEFDWNDKQSTYKGHDIGVIAQDIEKVLPELVNTRDNGYKAVKYDKLTALLIEAVKQQQEQIEKLEKLILKQ